MILLFDALLIGEERGAQRPDILGDQRGVDLMAQFLLKSLHDAAILCDASGHHYLIPHPDPVGKPRDPVGNRMNGAVDNIALVGALCKLADDLAFRKDGCRSN